MRILVVDDDPAIRFLLLTVFGDKHDVSLLCDGHNAISVLSDPNHGFDYVILDWKMPRLTGEKVLEFLSDWSNIRTKFVLIYGYKLEADSKRYPNLVACFSKPFSVKDLVALVERGTSARPTPTATAVATVAKA
jgi:DNA-binding response OmpR family regulator